MQQSQRMPRIPRRPWAGGGELGTTPSAWTSPRRPAQRVFPGPRPRARAGRPTSRGRPTAQGAPPRAGRGARWCRRAHLRPPSRRPRGGELLRRPGRRGPGGTDGRTLPGRRRRCRRGRARSPRRPRSSWAAGLASARPPGGSNARHRPG